MSKQPNKDDESPKEPARKKTCIRNKAEPDLTIVVDGEEFQEYSPSVRSWSDYFDTALDSCMKEAESKHFEFPDRDPREWEWIVAVMAPLFVVPNTTNNHGHSAKMDNMFGKLKEQVQKECRAQETLLELMGQIDGVAGPVAVATSQED